MKFLCRGLMTCIGNCATWTGWEKSYALTKVVFILYALYLLLTMNKCSDRGMEVKLPALLGNYDRPTNQPTETGQPTDGQTDRFISNNICVSYCQNQSFWRYPKSGPSCGSWSAGSPSRRWSQRCPLSRATTTTSRSSSHWPTSSNPAITNNKDNQADKQSLYQHRGEYGHY